MSWCREAPGERGREGRGHGEEFAALCERAGTDLTVALEFMPYRGPEDARAEAEQIFVTLQAILAAAGAALTDVVRVGVVMRELQRDRPVFNQVWAERFGEHRPARSAIQTPDLGRKARTPGS